jgi:hypothetical protein
MKLTLSQAAEQVGKSKSTLLRAIKKGSVSADRIDDVYYIDASELFRVFQQVNQGDAAQDESGRESWHTTHRPIEAAGAGEIRALNALVDTLKDVNSALQITNNTLMNALDSERAARQQLTLMLAHQNAQEEQKPKPDGNGWPLVVLAVLLVVVSVGAVAGMRLGWF